MTETYHYLRSPEVIPFRPGDTVQLHGGGLPMQVLAIDEHGRVSTEWRSGGPLYRGLFDGFSLELVPIQHARFGT